MPAPSLRPASTADATAVATIWCDGWRDGHLGHVPEALVRIRTPGLFDYAAVVPGGTIAVPAHRYVKAV